MKLESIKFVSVVYHILLALLKVQYLVLIGVIYILLKKISSVLGIVLTVLIIRVFHMKKIAQPCCLHLEYSERAFLMVGSGVGVMVISRVTIPGY